MVPVNPLKQLRLNKGYSIERLAAYVHISRQTIINNEAGQYENPSPAYLSALEILYHDDDYNFSDRYGEILSDYHKFQHYTRQQNYGQLCEPLPTYLPNQLLTHPVVYWAQVSQIPYTRISKLYCLHQGLMDRLKNQHHLMNYLPTAFTDALLESGYQSTTITELEMRFQTFKETLRADFALSNNRGGPA
jgi:transcriptional regulator with XRE-family HTH domain